jgi:putative ABC transport system permease protein
MTVGGIAATVTLMLFLVGVYEGVRKGAMSYVTNSPADIWLCNQNSTNLLRSTSFVPASLRSEIEQVKGVDTVAMILRFMATTSVEGKQVTLVLFGIDPRSRLSTPSTIISGSSSIRRGEIILDRAFAGKYGLVLGDSLHIQGFSFRVAAISEETNAIVAQFAFTTFEDAEQVLGIPGFVSFYLIKCKEGNQPEIVGDSLRRRFLGLAAFDRKEFIENNLEEMGRGVLPILWTIALMGVAVGITVITLMLYSSVLEKREDYALLKALGAEQQFLAFLVTGQSLAGAVFAFVLGLVFSAVASPFLIQLVPELSLSITWWGIFIVLGASLLIGIVAALVPIHKLSRIYPAEVFRA